MRTRQRQFLVWLAAGATAAVLGGCGSSSSSQSSPRTESSPAQTVGLTEGDGPVSMIMHSAPRSLDPARDDTTEGSEVNWLVYTGLMTYDHAGGAAGVRLAPGLATQLPLVTDGGRTYTFTLRKGLVFSNGVRVRASDFMRTVERAIKLHWPGARSFITPIILGARAYADGKARTISGITPDNRDGLIVIRLTAPYPPFLNVLALPALGLVPANAPLEPEPTTPPPGVGPYVATNIVPGHSFSVVQNPRWPSGGIPGIPAGKMNINVRIDRNSRADVLAVLANRADILDWVDPVPVALRGSIESQAPTRFRFVAPGTVTQYIFRAGLNPPFDSRFAREAIDATQRNVAAAEYAITGERPADSVRQPADFAEFASARMNFGALVFSPVFGWDLSSLVSN